MLKRLLEETPARRRAAHPPQRRGAPSAGSRASPARREAPVEAVFRSATRLNGADRRRTRATSCSTSRAAASPTRPATASASFRRTIRRWPRRCSARCGVPPDFPIGGKPFRDALIEDYALAPAPDALFELIGLLVGGERRQKAKALAAGEDPDGDAATLDVLAALEKFAGRAPRPGGVRRVPGAAAAASLLHLLLAAGDAGRGAL